MTKKILITGILGHIGSYLLRNHFLADEIVGVDDLSAERYCSLFKPNRKFHFIQDRFQNLQRGFLSHFDVVIHLAGKVNATESIHNRALYLKENAADAIAFWNECREAGVPLFIFPSTTSIYGKGEKEMWEDDDQFVNPQSAYADAKWQFEQHVRETRLKWWDRTNTTIVRLATIFGVSPGMRFHTAINKLTYQAAFDQPLTVWKENIDFHRPYLGLADFGAALEQIVSNENLWNQTFNIVSENKVMRDILEYIKEGASLWNKNVQINLTDCPLLNQNTYFVPNEKFEKASGMKFVGSVQRGINQTLEFLLGRV